MLTIFSGPDGSGKSTIIGAYKLSLESEGKSVEVFWLRFVSYFSKIVNGVARLMKKSYVEKYTWGHVGYHDYEGFLAYAYIFSSYIDQWLFNIFFIMKNKKVFKDTNTYHLYDRYLIDTIVDLMVDTKKDRFVLWLFSGLVRKLKKHVKIIILSCDEKKVLERRPDILDDKKYPLRINAFKKVRRVYQLKRVDTTNTSVSETINKLEL